MAGTVHVIGAGLAGLAAAIRLAEDGTAVVVHEAAPAAGGRCRSYRDSQLDLVIDNGNHLLLSGNWAARDFLARTGGAAALPVPAESAFPFIDLADGARWTLRPNDGRVPFWILDPKRRVPRSRVLDYLTPMALLRADPMARVGDVMRCDGLLYERLWRPLLLAGLNTEPTEAAAGLAARLVKETLAAGGRACRPMVATHGLAATFVEPALAHLRAAGATVRFGARLRRVACFDGRAQALEFDGETVELGAEDAVVLSVPAAVAPTLVPELQAPLAFRGIVNAHFRIAPPLDFPPIVGIVNGLSQWLFAFPDRLSVTISAADAVIDRKREDIAEAIWREVAAIADLPAALPAWQIVKERRATFAATPEEDARRPPTTTAFANLVLAGDWTRTGLPATIEGAVHSGYAAAAIVARRAARTQSRGGRARRPGLLRFARNDGGGDQAELTAGH
ncbi:MAG TPA: hydroxysqualene dehydroxylase HpnE [Hyphomicrobiales bacterium]|nr:hydroxysqualene dehydroxylase HpnE [Hyphomicrobiales bacterium]